MILNRLVLILSLCLCLAACQSPPVTQTRYVTLEEAWLQPCGYQAPPPKGVYVQASDRQRAIMMTKAYTNQLAYTKKCNTRMDQIRIYNEKAKERNKKVDTP